jgi:hypothetical protein
MSFDSIRARLAHLPEYIIPHAPQLDGSVALLDGNDDYIGEVGDIEHKHEIATFFSQAKHDIAILLADVDRLEAELAAARAALAAR